MGKRHLDRGISFCDSLHAPYHKLEVVVRGLRVAVLAGFKANDALVVLEDGFVRFLRFEVPACLEQLVVVAIEELNTH